MMKPLKSCIPLEAKRELAKKEGRLLTKKQREDKVLAERRKEALLASGVQIEGLQQATGHDAPAGKKVVYGNRKKKGLELREALSAPGSRPISPAPVAQIAQMPVESSKEGEQVQDDVKDAWDVSSDERETSAAVVGSVKDSWDASSDEEGNAPPSPVAAPTSGKKAIPTPVKSVAKGIIPNYPS
jgi:translation initiation factor 5B